jgi:uncharacterized membrane protein YdbT with pleckstrin-like domain
MAIEKIRAQMIGAIWQAVAQSGIDLSMISTPDQEKLVAQIADKLMVTMDSLLQESAAEVQISSVIDEPEAAGTAVVEETVLWEGRPLLSLVETYRVTSERLKIIRGLVARNVENIELIRIQDIDFKQGLSERIVGVGDITIHGQDASSPIITLRNVTNPEQVYEILRKAWLEARKRYGLQFREYM